MKKFILLLIFCLISPLIFGEVILQTDNISPSVNQPFTVEVKFLNQSKDAYELEGVENFQLLSKSTQSSISIVNGNKTSSKSDIYQFLPLHTGKAIVQVKLRDPQEKSNTLVFNIQKENVQTINKNTQLKINLKNNATYYFGEKIPFIENVLTTVGLDSLGYLSVPEFSGISSKDVTPVQNGNFQQKYFRTSNGQQGVEVITNESILMPNSSGEKIINVGKIQYTERTNNDPFFFNNNGTTKYLGGGNIKLNILPLPQNEPNNFQTVVGTPNITYNWSGNKVNYGESIVLNLTISGAVNLDTLEKIIPNGINGFNTFETIKSSNEGIINGKYAAQKSFEIAFIPRITGEVTIPQIDIPYFNTKTQKYEYLNIPAKKITVENSGTFINNNNSTPTSNNTGVTNSNNLSVSNNSNPPQEITISSINTGEEKTLSKNYIHLIIGLIILAIIEGVAIITLYYKNRVSKNVENLKELKNAKTDKEFYEAYCNFMKNRFNFSPKVHLEDRLIRLGLGEDFIKINREIEENYFSSTPLNRKELIHNIVIALKNIKK